MNGRKRFSWVVVGEVAAGILAAGLVIGLLSGSRRRR